MKYVSAAARVISSYLKRYPKTLAIRGVVAVFFCGYFYIFPGAVPIFGFLAFIVVFGYLVTKIQQFFGYDTDFSNRLTFFYEVFRVVWNLLSWPTEVDEI